MSRVLFTSTVQLIPDPLLVELYKEINGSTPVSRQLETAKKGTLEGCSCRSRLERFARHAQDRLGPPKAVYFAQNPFAIAFRGLVTRLCLFSPRRVVREHRDVIPGAAGGSTWPLWPKKSAPQMPLQYVADAP